MSTAGKIITATSLIVTVALGLAVFLYFRFWFVYAEGTDSGELNYFSRQGVLFKTYEGKVIQTGLKKSTTTQNGVQSNEFRFSVTDERVADSLMHSTGHQVELHYRKYNGVLPWRGESVFVVDSIWSVK